MRKWEFVFFSHWISSGHIVAIDSNCGLFGLSHLGDYCASKFAIIGEKKRKTTQKNFEIVSISLGYMECLEDELTRSKCTGVNTTSQIFIHYLRLSVHFIDFSRHFGSNERRIKSTCHRNCHVKSQKMFFFSISIRSKHLSFLFLFSLSFQSWIGSFSHTGCLCTRNSRRCHHQSEISLHSQMVSIFRIHQKFSSLWRVQSDFELCFKYSQSKFKTKSSASHRQSSMKKQKAQRAKTKKRRKYFFFFFDFWE